MVKLKEIPRTSAFAWSPFANDPMMVTGTVAGAIDADFSANTQLEFWDLDLRDRSSDRFQVKPKVAVDTEARLYDIAWGTVSSAKPRGIVAGALENGTLAFWDPQQIVDEGVRKPVDSRQKHSGAIKSLEFNHHQPHLLASAGARGEIFMWDFNKLDSPYSPGAQSTRHDEIECVAWNRSVSHILATAGNTGFTSVWDLKNKREVLHLHYSGESTGRRAVSSVVWHPTNSTKLITASQDDTSAVILLWDLRNANAPERVLQGHEKGILSLDWCVHDSGLLLSSGKDNKTLLWNPETGHKLAEYPIATNWSFQTRFNPRIPDMFATASFDGTISVQTLQDVGSDGTEARRASAGGSVPAAGANGSDDFWNPSSYVDSQHPVFALQQAPRWLKRPSSVMFGFGGKLVSVATTNGHSSISISKFVGEDSISDRTTKFADALKSADLGAVAKDKADAAASPVDKYDWTVLSALFGPGSRADNLASYYETAEINKTKEKIEVKSDKAQDKTQDKTQDKAQDKAQDQEQDMFGKSDDDFLATLSQSSTYTPQGPFSVFNKDQPENEVQITNKVLKGDFDGAVDVALQADSLSDAFALALHASEAAKTRVQNAYLKHHAGSKPFLRLLASFTGNNIDDVVDNCSVDEWRLVVTGLFTFCKDETKFVSLCGKLGDRLLQRSTSSSADKEAAEYRNSALLCYVAGLNLAKAAGLWLSEVSEAERTELESGTASTPYSAHVKALHYFIEKVAVLRKVVGTVDNSQAELSPLHEAYREYANIVASQGDLALAEQYLNLLPAQDETVRQEKERISRASNKPVASTKPVTTTSTTRRQNIAPQQSIYSPGRTTHNRQGSTSVNVPPPGIGANSYGNPVLTQAPTQQAPLPPATQPPVPKASNPYAPVGAATPSIYSQSTYGGYGTQAPAASIPGPPLAGNSTAAPPPPPPSKRESVSGWNDLPTGALANSAPKRPASATPQTIASPFPNQPLVPLPPSTVTSPQLYNRAGMVPPTGPPPSGPPPTGSAHTGAARQPQQVVPPPPPSAVSPGIPSRYAPPPGAGSVGLQYGQPASGIVPPRPASNSTVPAPPVNPYAVAAQQPQLVQPSQSSYVPPPGAATGPPPSGAGLPRGPPPPGAPPAAYAVSPPPFNQFNAAPPPVPEAAPPAPEPVEPPKPRHPVGDRTHIPGYARPIYDILEAELTRVTPLIPKDFERHLNDAHKRLNILFEHLNQEEVLSRETIDDMVNLAQAVAAKDFATAEAIKVSLMTARSDEVKQWMTGVGRLINMSKAVP